MDSDLGVDFVAGTGFDVDFLYRFGFRRPQGFRQADCVAIRRST